MGKRRIGVIGLGMAVTPHAKSLQELGERCDVLAFSRSAERRSDFAASFGLPVTGHIDDIIEAPDIDAVMLLTPPNARLELVQRLAGAGKPILMEKPLERSLEAALEIVRMTEAAGVQTGVVFQHRFREGALALAALLAEGALGALATVQLDVPWWRPQSYYDEPGRGTFERDGGGVLITQAIHAIDLMLSFTGPVREVQALTATTLMHRLEGEDFATGGLVFENGAIGTLTATTTYRPGFTEKLVLAGTEATAVLEGGKLSLYRADGTTESSGDVGGIGGGADPMAFSHAWHKAVITDFLDALDEGRPATVSARDALAVHRLIDAMLRSSRDGARVTVS